MRTIVLIQKKPDEVDGMALPAQRFEINCDFSDVLMTEGSVFILGDDPVRFFKSDIATMEIKQF